MVYAVGVLAALVLGESWLLWRVGRALGPLAHFADRLAQLSGAVNLLTETAESGFVSFAGVLNEAMQTSPDRRAPRAPRVSPDRTAETAPAPASDVTAPRAKRSRVKPVAAAAASSGSSSGSSSAAASAAGSGASNGAALRLHLSPGVRREA